MGKKLYCTEEMITDCKILITMYCWVCSINMYKSNFTEREKEEIELYRSDNSLSH